MFPTAPTCSRRTLLRQTACGFGYLAFADLATRAAEASRNPLGPKPPHFAPRARRVIFLFMSGGPSHIDTFDYKPELQKHDGQEAPTSAAGAASKVRRGDKLLGSPWAFRRHGKSGLWISDLFPHLARCADDLCLLHGMHTDSPNHATACRQFHTGATNCVRPSVGAWTLYGLGTENDSLPGFVTVGQLGRGGGAENRGSAFLPAVYQGTPLGSGTIVHLNRPDVSRDQRRRQVQALRTLNDELQDRLTPDPQLDAVIESYELAFRMQAVAPEVLDLDRETKQTQRLYGMDRPETKEMGRNCLLARRLAEAGVRFIEVGGSGSWDHHARLKGELADVALHTDQPIAALLTDLRQRGMLQDTLVVWGGEFGRTPASGRRDGRDHNVRGYTIWLAGGGVRGGFRHGATDELGFAAVEGKVHIHDLHATILHLLGLDHERLTYRHSGRDFRLTDVHGRVVKEIIA